MSLILLSPFSWLGRNNCTISGLFPGFSGGVKPPPATLSMVAGGGGLVFHVLMLFVPCSIRPRPRKCVLDATPFVRIN